MPDTPRTESPITPAPAKPDVRLPSIGLDPPLPSPSEYEGVDAVRSALLAHDGGSFRNGALLAERMWWNPRVWSVLQTRANGLIATEIRWREGRRNRDGRRALAAWREDYPRMVSTATRRQRAWYGLTLGLAFAQRRPEWNPKTGRHLLVLQPYWPGHAQWNQSQRVYRVQMGNGGGYVDVPSIAMGGAIDPLKSAWYVYEPNGPYSWRWGLIHPFWYVWYILDRAIRDGARFAEKHGIGILKAFFPDSRGDEAKNAEARFAARLRAMGGEGVIPLRRGANKDESDQDVQPLEFSGGAGFAGIESTRNASNVDIAVAGLGHNLTTEVKGGSFAAANVGDYIRADYKEHDALGEIEADYSQLGRAWALVNFGDPDLAPIGEAETDPPAADQTAAATLQALAQALASLPQDVRAIVDVESLLDRFSVALRTSRPDAPMVSIPPPAGEDGGDEMDAQSVVKEPAPAAAPAAKPEVKAVEIPLTPTDIATVVTVDEARASLDLDGVGGDEGARYVAEHAAKIRAVIAPEIAQVARAEDGATPAPGSPPPAAPASPAPAPPLPAKE